MRIMLDSNASIRLTRKHTLTANNFDANTSDEHRIALTRALKEVYPYDKHRCRGGILRLRVY